MYLLSHIFLTLNKNKSPVGVSLKKNEIVKGLISGLFLLRQSHTKLVHETRGQWKRQILKYKSGSEPLLSHIEKTSDNFTDCPYVVKNVYVTFEQHTRYT